jgi:hypothetical protein
LHKNHFSNEHLPQNHILLGQNERTRASQQQDLMMRSTHFSEKHKTPYSIKCSMKSWNKINSSININDPYFQGHKGFQDFERKRKQNKEVSPKGYFNIINPNTYQNQQHENEVQEGGSIDATDRMINQQIIYNKLNINFKPSSNLRGSSKINNRESTSGGTGMRGRGPG